MNNDHKCIALLASEEPVLSGGGKSSGVSLFQTVTGMTIGELVTTGSGYVLKPKLE